MGTRKTLSDGTTLHTEQITPTNLGILSSKLTAESTATGKDIRGGKVVYYKGRHYIFKGDSLSDYDDVLLHLINSIEGTNYETIPASALKDIQIFDFTFEKTDQPVDKITISYASDTITYQQIDQGILTQESYEQAMKHLSSMISDELNVEVETFHGFASVTLDRLDPQTIALVKGVKEFIDEIINLGVLGFRGFSPEKIQGLTENIAEPYKTPLENFFAHGYNTENIPEQQGELLRKFFKRYDYVFYLGAENKMMFGKVHSTIPIDSTTRVTILDEPVQNIMDSGGFASINIDDEVYIISDGILKDSADRIELTWFHAVHETAHKAIQKLLQANGINPLEIEDDEYAAYLTALAQLEHPAIRNHFFQDLVLGAREEFYFGIDEMHPANKDAILRINNEFKAKTGLDDAAIRALSPTEVTRVANELLNDFFQKLSQDAGKTISPSVLPDITGQDWKRLNGDTIQQGFQGETRPVVVENPVIGKMNQINQILPEFGLPYAIESLVSDRYYHATTIKNLAGILNSMEIEPRLSPTGRAAYISQARKSEQDQSIIDLNFRPEFDEENLRAAIEFEIDKEDLEARVDELFTGRIWLKSEAGINLDKATKIRIIAATPELIPDVRTALENAGINIEEMNVEIVSQNNIGTEIRLQNIADRVQRAEELLNRPFTESQIAALIQAHEVGVGPIGQYTEEEIAEKARILHAVGFTTGRLGEIRKLMDSGIVGNPGQNTQFQELSNMFKNLEITSSIADIGPVYITQNAIVTFLDRHLEGPTYPDRNKIPGNLLAGDFIGALEFGLTDEMIDVLHEQQIDVAGEIVSKKILRTPIEYSIIENNIQTDYTQKFEFRFRAERFDIGDGNKFVLEHFNPIAPAEASP